MKKKKRIAELLVERELAEDIDKAKRAVMAGLVYSGEERIDKPGSLFPVEKPLRIKDKGLKYVGRGGYKLEKALQLFSVAISDKIFMDIGSSTGGFTDCALKNGAKKCYAIDVGYNQLDWKLRNDPRVIEMERTNFRHVTPDMLTCGLPEVASIDVSFISLKHIFPVLATLLNEKNDVIALIKPQFEAFRDQVGEKGIVRDPAVHLEVLERVIKYAADASFTLVDMTYSPIKGTEGNIEFLAHFKWKHDERQKEMILTEVVKEAQLALMQ
ncbi:TlyA family RNA methyltransferase [Oceanobacillus sp. CFH 90083]|uniref:TlyA family RNA methyltransferase n=1 Tax=Oceanobacillus sp. CFH 90083 TaxID=2592336 RepID=UPI00128D1933|nr:TlyA family RNA methyltransferase [Oceanobacillus sp. CFH 90083]